MTYEPSPELIAQIEADRRARAAEIAKIWRDELSHKDWLLNGSRCTPEAWENLDWSKAWIDLGPSPAGNLGPYWHVPHKNDDDGIVYRLYPKVMQSKWALLILHACNEMRNDGKQP